MKRRQVSTDRAQGDAIRSAEINAAYRTLTDRDAREKYDSELRRNGPAPTPLRCVACSDVHVAYRYSQAPSPMVRQQRKSLCLPVRCGSGTAQRRAHTMIYNTGSDTVGLSRVLQRCRGGYPG